MKTFAKFFWGHGAWAMVCLLLGATPAFAQNLKLEARLVWGVTNQITDTKYMPTDPALSDKLHDLFKWKEYYELNRVSETVPSNDSREFHMSDKCVLKIKNLGGSRVEISCMGKGKEVCKGEHTMTAADWVVFGGNCKNNTAWFIGLHLADER